MLVSPDGDVTITNDGATILAKVLCPHVPFARRLLLCVQSCQHLGSDPLATVALPPMFRVHRGVAPELPDTIHAVSMHVPCCLLAAAGHDGGSALAALLPAAAAAAALMAAALMAAIGESRWTWSTRWRACWWSSASHR
jgi:hypothetical protein